MLTQQNKPIVAEEPLDEPHKIRRRCEEALRKMDDMPLLLEIATKLKVKTKRTKRHKNKTKPVTDTKGVHDEACP